MKNYTQIGHCPNCDGSNLDYGDTTFEDEQLYFEVECLDCKWEGKEWFNLTFIEYSDREKEEKEQKEWERMIEELKNKTKDK